MRPLLCFFLLMFGWQLLSAQDENKPCKCCNEAYRQFDFWVGDWETYNADGKVVGTNHIKILQDSCVIQENWSSSGGAFTGTSYNFYDANTKQWHQTWVDNQGGNLQLSGHWTDSTMVMYSRPAVDPQGKNYLNRITWTPFPNGNVQQLWEVSNDYGSTWSVLFDGLYKLKEQ